jgi:hypothetical protein
MLKTHRQAVEFMSANKPAVVEMTVQKLGANRAAVEQALGADNIEYVWKLDDKVQGQAKTYAQHMLEMKQIRAAAQVRRLPQSEVLERIRQLRRRAADGAPHGDRREHRSAITAAAPAADLRARDAHSLWAASSRRCWR